MIRLIIKLEISFMNLQHNNKTKIILLELANNLKMYQLHAKLWVIVETVTTDSKHYMKIEEKRLYWALA